MQEFAAEIAGDVILRFELVCRIDGHVELLAARPEDKGIRLGHHLIAFAQVPVPEDRPAILFSNHAGSICSRD